MRGNANIWQPNKTGMQTGNENTVPAIGAMHRGEVL